MGSRLPRASPSDDDQEQPIRLTALDIGPWFERDANRAEDLAQQIVQATLEPRPEGAEPPVVGA
ncbi:hypothetical protein GCM10010193_68080 [Kitasatospora atroaurantiaca]|uniref:Uncharacterized protein n=1 Tax=Kitasatospora atroaurantiaca TaxID=285545 RepID=A0A561EHR7_9ACTN|nr:hypothetical protein [Kitasatospora atroaurantiaca]TWE15159.1 hypothetical protein FB465_0031 [Kitasatospora atroaurantiaca]